jgi:hypothetical protein
LNLPNLIAARKRVMREITDHHTSLMQLISVGGGHPSAADKLPITIQVEQIRRSTGPNSPYSKAARTKLIALGIPELCAQPED